LRHGHPNPNQVFQIVYTQVLFKKLRNFESSPSSWNGIDDTFCLKSALLSIRGE
jgi:hypothetical protein